MRKFIQSIEWIFKGDLLTRFYFFLIKLTSKCKDCADGYYYPQYGIAPHTHNLKNAHGFIGLTEILPKEKWPENYDDVDNGAGVWYCPNNDCVHSKGMQKRIKKELKIKALQSLYQAKIHNQIDEQTYCKKLTEVLNG